MDHTDYVDKERVKVNDLSQESIPKKIKETYNF